MSDEQQAKNMVLIVDDEPAIRGFIAELLGDAGYECIHTRNGQEALDYLRRARVLPQVILLDMMLPEVSGVQFLLQRHEDRVLAQIPIILMTGNSKLIRAGELLGETEHLEKPFQIDVLLEMVDRLCQPQQVAVENEAQSTA